MGGSRWGWVLQIKYRASTTFSLIDINITVPTFSSSSRRLDTDERRGPTSVLVLRLHVGGSRWGWLLWIESRATDPHPSQAVFCEHNQPDSARRRKVYSETRAPGRTSVHRTSPQGLSEEAVLLPLVQLGQARGGCRTGAAPAVDNLPA